MDAVESQMNNLDGIKSGIYKVYTETSAYIIDFENTQAKRLPGEGLGANPNSKKKIEPQIADLHKDGEWFRFLTVSTAIGKEMAIWCIDVRDHFTYRFSTDVMKIEKLENI